MRGIVCLGAQRGMLFAAALTTVLAGGIQMARADQSFCVRYSGHASSTATVAEQTNCGFDFVNGRWTTNRDQHFNWCMQLFQDAGSDANKQVAARNLAESEDAARIAGLKECQARVAATPAPPAPQMLTEQMICSGGGGMTARQETGGTVVIPFAPALQNANAAMPGPGQCAWADRPFGASEPMQLGLRMPLPNGELLIAATNGGTFTVMARPIVDHFVLIESVVSVNVVDSSPLSPGPIDATVPAPGGGGQQTASICRLPVGTATVVIADPALTQLNVRDKPNGAIFPVQIPEGAQVNVVGSCGVQINAGIVAGGGNAEAPVLGWCAISSPQVGCVKDDFLVAGIPAGGQAGGPGTVGIAAIQPQTQTAPQQPQAPPQQVVVPGPLPQTGASTARLTQGANIRNAPTGGDAAKTGSSLPAGTIVTVLECVPNWCRIALPQFPVAWVSRGFLAFDVAAAPAAGPSAGVTIDLGGGGVAPPAPPAPAPGGGGQSTTSICGLPGGTATVVIPDPAITQLNVRDAPGGNIFPVTIPEGTQVTVVGNCGVRINAGIVAGAGNAQPPVPGWCAISSPQVGCVSEQFLVAGLQAGGPVGAPGTAGLAGPQLQAAATFTGRWSAEAQGSPYTFNLTQVGDNVSGAYIGGDGSQGQLTGTLAGNVLRFQWWQADGVRGMGKFTLSADGSAFTGSYTLGNDPDIADGSWNGQRQ